MINLMYVVLMAMLALNVSSDVLNGFKLIGERLKSSTDNSSLQNKAIYNTLSDAMKPLGRHEAEPREDTPMV